MGHGKVGGGKERRKAFFEDGVDAATATGGSASCDATSGS